MARLHLIVRGRVQGVGFRATVYDCAIDHGLKGWVRNNADGSVECVAEGSGEALAALQRLFRAGPPGARVASLDVLTEPESGEFRGFHVHPTR
ncbi:acylphosphatase [bacterium]|nr:MAG: acylphosphatase [bacterium]